MGQVTIAYHMQDAYKITKTQGEAIERVKDKHPEADMNMLYYMWIAIDAYVDIEKSNME